MHFFLTNKFEENLSRRIVVIHFLKKEKKQKKFELFLFYFHVLIIIIKDSKKKNYLHTHLSQDGVLAAPWHGKQFFFFLCIYTKFILRKRNLVKSSKSIFVKYFYLNSFYELTVL